MMPVEQYQALANIDSEMALCGALLRDNAKIDAVADRLAPEDFSEPLLADIYSVIVREAALGHPANPVTLRPYLVEHPAIADVGGISYLGKLAANDSAAWLNPVELADQVKSLSARRALVSGLQAASTLATDPAQTNEIVIDRTEAALSAATVSQSSAAEIGLAECIRDMIDDMANPVSGVTCGRISSLDQLLGEMRPKQLVIGAGRPGMGKTALALSYALGAAQNGHGVLYVSLEMSAPELATRMASDLAFDGRRGIPFDAILNGRVNSDQLMQLARITNDIAELPFTVADYGSLNIGRLNMMVRRYKRRLAAKGHKLELVVVDYLQLVHPDHQTRSAYEAVSAVSRGLKAIAKDHDVAVFALAQLSRSVESREDKRPQLSDLRDSGQIEQDADAVLFLYRHEYYVRRAEPDEMDPKHADWQRLLQDCEGKLELILAKRRNGRIGKALAHFHASNQAVRG